MNLRTSIRPEILSVSPKRYMAGVSFSRDAKYVSGVILSICGTDHHLEPSLITQGHVEVPITLQADIQEVIQQQSFLDTPCLTLNHQIAELQTIVIENILHESGIDPLQLNAVGVIGPEIWSNDPEQQVQCLTLGSPTALAETTGITVIDAFSERDIAVGGLGGPLQLLPLSLIFQQLQASKTGKPRLIISADQAIDAFYIKPRSIQQTTIESSWLPIAPGESLRSAIFHHSQNNAHQKSLKQHELKELVSKWSKIQELYDLPAWSTTGIERELFVSQIKGRIDADQIDPLLTEFWCHQIQQVVQRQFPQSPQLADILIYGSLANELSFLNLLKKQLDPTAIKTVEELAWATHSIDAACGALLAALHIDKIPANLPKYTGAKAARILGRITPGSPAHWQMFVETLQQRKTSKMLLRDAV